MNMQTKRNIRMAIAFMAFIVLAILTTLFSDRSTSGWLLITMASLDIVSFIVAVVTTYQACRTKRKLWCIPFFPLLAITLPMLSIPTPLHAQQVSGSGSYIYTVVGSDGFLHLAADNSLLLDINGNRVYISADGSLKALTSDGQTVEPQFINILGIVVGLIIVAVGAYVAYRLYKWAKKVLNPPPPPPPTNQPPNTWTNVPPVAFVATNTSIAFCVDDSVATNGWCDWQGNPVGYCIAGSVRLDQWSMDLVTWEPMTCYVTGYVSVISLDSRGMDYEVETNMLTISYGPDGSPFATNWCSLANDGHGLITNKLLGASYRVPRLPNQSHAFFRLLTP